MSKRIVAGVAVLVALWSAPSVGQTFEEFLEVAVPIESRLQGCYGQLDYFELTSEERIRLDHASAYLNEIPISFASAHTAEAYEAAEMEYLMRLAEANQKRPKRPCDSAYVDQMEQEAKEIWDRFRKIQSPFRR